MDFYDRVANFIANLQDLPEHRRHSIFFTVMAFMVLASGVLGVVQTKSNVERIRKDYQQASLIGFREEVKDEQVVENQDQVVNDVSRIDIKSSDLISGWEKYYNVDYLYEIQYPLEWLVDSSKTEQVYISSDIMEGENINKSYIKVVVSPIEENISIDSQIEKTVQNLQSDLFSLKKIEIGGEEGFVIKFVCGELNCGPTEHFVIKNNHLYNIYSNIESEALINQIIATFNFI